VFHILAETLHYAIWEISKDSPSLNRMVEMPGSGLCSVPYHLPEKHWITKVLKTQVGESVYEFSGQLDFPRSSQACHFVISESKRDIVYIFLIDVLRE